MAGGYGQSVLIMVRAGSVDELQNLVISGIIQVKYFPDLMMRCSTSIHMCPLFQYSVYPTTCERNIYVTPGCFLQFSSDRAEL